jgi:TrmH family RNA methyltransferase
MQLTSARNPLLQSIRRSSTAGRPTEEGLIVAEGPHLVEEALLSEWRIEQLFTTPAARDRYADLLGAADAEIVEVSARAFASLAATENSQEVLALVRPRTWSWEDLAGRSALLVVLDAMQDPGNAGTIVRSAEAFGATGVILLRGSARVANGKFLRASAGSIFRIPYLEGWEAGDLLGRAQSSEIKLYALNQSAERDVAETNLRARCVLIVGSEGHGLTPELASSVDQISIRTAKVESLNAAVAGSIALFEARRQRNSNEPV